MGMSSTCVLLYAMPYFQGCMPCIFVISLVTSTSMQTRLRNVSDFRDLVISLSLWLLLFCCYVSMWLQRDLWSFWRCSVRMFCRYCCNWSIPAFFAIMECHSMTQSCSTFAIKYFWQIVYVLFNFAKLVVVDPYMLCFCSCHGWLYKHSILL